MTSASNLSVGVDIGGTKISACLVDQTGHVSFVERAPTPSKLGSCEILDVTENLVKRVVALANHSPVACGIGSAGSFDHRGRVVYATDHLAGWTDTDVSAGMEERLGFPVVVINDVHAAALGELWFGCSRGLERMAFVAVGTGIGGAIVAGGRVLLGDFGMAGAVGHLPITTRDMRICSCGGINHIESYASGPGIERTYRERTGNNLGLQEIGGLASREDQVALSVIHSAAELLAEALVDFITVTDPGTVVLGGGVLELGEIFLRLIADHVKSGLQSPLSNTLIRATLLGNEACMVGAGALAMRIADGQSAFA